MTGVTGSEIVGPSMPVRERLLGSRCMPGPSVATGNSDSGNSDNGATKGKDVRLTGACFKLVLLAGIGGASSDRTDEDSEDDGDTAVTNGEGAGGTRSSVASCNWSLPSDSESLLWLRAV